MVLHLYDVMKVDVLRACDGVEFILYNKRITGLQNTTVLKFLAN